MNKKIIVSVVIIIFVIGGIVFLLNKPSAVPIQTQPTEQMQQNSQNNQPPTNTNTTPAPNTVSPIAPSPKSIPGSASVMIKNFQFSPNMLTVKKGTKVTWTNNDGTAHTVTADQGSGPQSSPLNQGDIYSFTFNTAGVFSYHCSIHPSMHGSIIVQ